MFSDMIKISAQNALISVEVDDVDFLIARSLTPSVAHELSSVIYLDFVRNNIQLKTDLINPFLKTLQFYGKAHENSNTLIFKVT